nr:hypothetical protein CFP56_58161 [Quercus suber]
MSPARTAMAPYGERQSLAYVQQMGDRNFVLWKEFFKQKPARLMRNETMASVLWALLHDRWHDGPKTHLHELRYSSCYLSSDRDTTDYAALQQEPHTLSANATRMMLSRASACALLTRADWSTLFLMIEALVDVYK